MTTTTTTATTESPAPTAGASASTSFSTGIRALAPFARADRARYILSAALAAAGTICHSGRSG